MEDIIKASYVLVVMGCWFLSPIFWRMLNDKKYDATGAVTATIFLLSIYIASII